MLKWLHQTWIEFWDLFGSESVRPVEMVLGIIKLAFGIALLLPNDTFGSGKVYEALKDWGELTWGVLFISFALTQMLAAIKRWFWVRLVCSWLAAAVWGLVAASFFEGNPSGVGAWFVGAFAAINVWLAVRLPRDKFRGRE